MGVPLNIEKMAYGPFALSHLENGKTVFVEHAVPGDMVVAEVYEDKRSFARARVIDVLEASPHRVRARAPELIGNLAPWQILDYDLQLASKQTIVADALLRVGHFSADEVERSLGQIVAAPHTWNYRNKIELAVGHDKAGKLFCGFHQHKSKHLDACARCALALKSIEGVPRAIEGALRYLSGTDDLGIFRVGVRASEQTGSVQIALWTPPSGFPRSFAAKTLMSSTKATSVVRVLARPGSSRRVKRVEVLEGAPTWTETMAGGITYAISAPSFFQVNTEQANMLVECALDGLALEAGERVADLYCGAGTFTIPFARAGADVIAVEEAGSSVNDLARNAERNKVDLDIICDDVARVIGDIGAINAVLVDPPRTGLAPEVISGIASTGARRVCYVSCDPQSMARDLRRFSEHGFELRHITPVDLFPQTFHVECVCILHKP